MATNYIQEGQRLSFTAGAAVNSGDLVLVNALAVVALTDLALGAKGSGAVEGVFELSGKDNTLAIAQGEKVYRVIATGKLSNLPTDAVYVGIAWEDAAEAATTVRVKLNA